MDLKITSKDIESAEKLLLPEGAHFAEEQKDVIRYWRSTDVVACPGSGKTTVLLAKLKLLADRMPLENGAGICVLSRTNAAVNEIKERLSDCTDKLNGYPNYIGTIQSFIDKYMTKPYLICKYSKNVHVVDDSTYAQHMLIALETLNSYSALNNLLKSKLKFQDRFNNMLGLLEALYVDDRGSLRVQENGKVLCKSGAKSAKQYKKLVESLLKEKGIIRFKDSYKYAEEAIRYFPDSYSNLFALRFQYVFIDDYQDCSLKQKNLMNQIFDSSKCTFIRIGDPNQVIFDMLTETTLEWEPVKDHLTMINSYRFSQEIADVISKINHKGNKIVAASGKTGIKPVLFIFDSDTKNKVIDAFINELNENELDDPEGIYKAIGAIKSKRLTGLKISDYWSDFESCEQSKNNYWQYLDEVIRALKEGKLYEAGDIVFRLIFVICDCKKQAEYWGFNRFTNDTMKKRFFDNNSNLCRQWLYELSLIKDLNRNSLNLFLRKRLKKLPEIGKINDISENIPEFFSEENVGINKIEQVSKNTLVEPQTGRKIVFNTIYGVRGETHDATLYLETERLRGSDLSRILWCFGIGENKNTVNYKSSRNLAYAGMSRPRKLLCVAMQEKTYEKTKGVFKLNWKIVDLRNQKLSTEIVK